MNSNYSYRVNAHWTGAGTGSVTPDEMKLPIFFSTPPEFGGEAGHWTPEHMLIAAVASCYVATFSAIAQKSSFDFLDLEVSVAGVLGKTEAGLKFTEIVIRPVLAIDDAANEERGIRLLQKAERSCLIARSLSGAITLESKVHVPEPDLIFAE